jgi:protoheme IX farnesyltransferase
MTALRPSADVQKFSMRLQAVVLFQIGLGVVNVLLLAPIWMQMLHLLVSELLWVTLILLTASALSVEVPHVELTTETVKAELEYAGKPTWKDYLVLTKPRVISLLLFTTWMGMVIAANGWPGLTLFLVTGLGLYMAAGASNAINMVLERDLDVRMERTATRPTVTHKIPPRDALKFAFVLATGSFVMLWAVANLLAALMALSGLVVYIVVYTMLLKRRTWSNIVIGGAAGAFPPLVGYAAVTGELTALAWSLFAIIFLWTPVHFWALAILIKDDYAKAGVPMLPVVKGERHTVIQIGGYAILTALVSAVPLVLGVRGPLYVGSAVLLNAVLLWQSFELWRQTTRPRASKLFHFSMLYLALLFLAMAVDRSIWKVTPVTVAKTSVALARIDTELQ